MELDRRKLSVLPLSARTFVPATGRTLHTFWACLRSVQFIESNVKQGGTTKNKRTVVSISFLASSCSWLFFSFVSLCSYCLALFSAQFVGVVLWMLSLLFGLTCTYNSPHICNLIYCLPLFCLSRPFDFLSVRARILLFFMLSLSFRSLHMYKPSISPL